MCLGFKIKHVREGHFPKQLKLRYERPILLPFRKNMKLGIKRNKMWFSTQAQVKSYMGRCFELQVIQLFFLWAILVARS